MKKQATRSEVDRLADFLLKHHPDEIGKGGSESAVEVAIRMISENVQPMAPKGRLSTVEANLTAMLIEVEQRVKTTDDMLSCVEDTLSGENSVRRADQGGGPVCAMGILARVDHIMTVSRTAEERAQNIMTKLGVARD